MGEQTSSRSLFMLHSEVNYICLSSKKCAQFCQQ